MATLRQLRAANPTGEARYTLDDYVQWLSTGTLRFPVTGRVGDSAAETPDGTFQSYADVYRSNGIVYACMAIRQDIFSEVTFRFAQVKEGKVGRLFGTPELGVLERPWPNGSTGELAARMIQDVDLAGNFYAVRQGNRLYRRDPSKMSIVLAGHPLEDEFVDVAGYVYQPNGPSGPTYSYKPDEVCHWSPKPDPTATYRGMSWLTPVLREIRADNAATDHKAEFFANGATPNMVVTFPPDVMTKAQFDEFKATMDSAHVGRGNRYKTLYLAPGADVTPVGADFQQLAFDATQGRDETRIASAAGVPPVIVGLKESLQGSSLNAGNYGSSRRRFADATMRPLYRSAADALSTLVRVPGNDARLWYDDSQVAFFREDRADAATIQQTKANTIRALVDAGYDAPSVVAAVEAEDMSLLQHSGLFSVQLQPPGTQAPAKDGENSLASAVAALATRETPAPVVNIHPAPPRSKRLERDADGVVTGIVEDE